MHRRLIHLMTGLGGMLMACSGTVAVTPESGGTSTAPDACHVGDPAACGPGAWCQPDPDLGAPCSAGMPGVCQPKPESCAPGCSPVCGCDGSIYCSACEAALNGVATSTDQSCLASPPSDAVYRALIPLGDLQFFVLEASSDLDLCFLLVAELQWGAGIGISGDGFEVTRAGALPGGYDTCVAGVPLQVWQAFENDGWMMAEPGAAAGTMAVELSPGGGCEVSVHGQVTFAGAPAWMPAAVTYDVDGLPIESGCP